MKRFFCIVLAVLLVLPICACKGKSKAEKGQKTPDVAGERILLKEYITDDISVATEKYLYNSDGTVASVTFTDRELNRSTSDVYTYENGRLSTLTVTDADGVEETFKAEGDKYNQSFYFGNGELYKAMKYDEYGCLVIEAFASNYCTKYDYVRDENGKIVTLKKYIVTNSGSNKTVLYNCEYGEDNTYDLREAAVDEEHFSHIHVTYENFGGAN